MNEQNLNVADIYKKCYETWEKNSICLNMKKYESERGFHFLLKGCGYVLDEEDYVVFFRDYGSLAFPGYWLKTKNCEVVIDCKYKYFSFKYIIKKLEKGISEWEKQFLEYGFSHFSLNHVIEEKAVVDVLKKEISFMKNRLIFRKWWFLRGFEIAKQ